MNQTMQEFFTRERANEGIKLPLSFPDGRESEHWIRIRGIDSDAFKQAEAASNRRIFMLTADKATDKVAMEKVEEDEKLELLCALVIDWSFPDPCNLDTIKKLLREAPQIATQINRLSNRRSLFFGNSSKTSTPSPEPTSS